MSLEEKIAGEFNHFLKIMNHKEEGKPDESLSEDEKRHSISLMRVNASGEVAAQALYRGQAFFAKSKKVKKHLLKACLLYTSPSPRDTDLSRKPSSA